MTNQKHIGRSFFFLVILSVFFGYVGCRGDKSSGDQLSDTVVDADTTAQENFLSHLQEEDRFRAWVRYYLADSQWVELKFSPMDSSNRHLSRQHMDLDQQFFDKYGELLVYNQDSSAFVDLFSYSVVLVQTRNGRWQMRGTEADQEVAVVNAETGERTRILFCGPACSIEEATWYNDDIVALFGLSDNEGSGNYQPVIWLVNFHTGETRSFESPHDLGKWTPHAYTRKVLIENGYEVD